MSMKLAQKLRNIKMTEFQFTDFEKKVTAGDDDKIMEYVTVTLSEPIEVVTGTQRLFSPTDRTKAAHIQAYDVTEVNIEIDLIDEFDEDFKFEEDKDGKFTGTGSYAGNLRLDVSQGDKVWLVKQSLAQRSAAWRQSQKNVKIDAIIQRAAERQKAKQGS